MNIIQRVYAAVVNKPTTSELPEKVMNLNAERRHQTINRNRKDVSSLRNALAKAEQVWYPQRVELQEVYADTVLDAHVSACMLKRHSLTLARKYELHNGNSVDEKNTQVIQAIWFKNIITYILESMAYGYSLIALGDIVNSSFPKLTLVSRPFVSPDRLIVSPFKHMLSGTPFLEEPYSDWHIWVDSPTDNGISACGYGYLLKVSLYEILKRNNQSNNADFNELFAQPLRIAKTNKTDEEELNYLESQMVNIGSSSYAILDMQDEIEFVESSQKSGAVQTYESFEKRLEAKISKVILGHADAIDSTPGKLGAESSTQDSLLLIKESDGYLVESVVNEKVLPLLAKHKLIPNNLVFKFSNSDEVDRQKDKQLEDLQKWATIAQTMSLAGYYLDPKIIEENTGVTLIEQPRTTIKESVQNKLKRIYGI